MSLTSKKELFAEVSLIFSETSGCPVSDLILETSFFRNLVFSEDDMRNFFFALEDRFSITIPEEDWTYIDTAGDLVEYLHGREYRD